MNALIYDCEIIRAIPHSDKPDLPEIQYCAGWHDINNMGLSCISVYDYQEDAYRVFLADNFEEFQELANNRKHIIGFNSLSFDDRLCRFNGLHINTTYDLLVEVFLASGQPPIYTKGVTRSGYGLDDIALANLGRGKSGNGATAPVLWQEGARGQVIDYCLRDVTLTKKLFDRRGALLDPTTKEVLHLPTPSGLPLGAGGLEVRSRVNAGDLEPMIEMLVDGRLLGQLSPTDMRQHALRLLAAAEAAQADSLLLRFCLDVTKGDHRMASVMLKTFRDLREETDRLRAMNGERHEEDA